MPRKPKSKSKISGASRTGKQRPSTTRYELAAKPYASFDRPTDTLSVTAQPAFLRDDGGWIQKDGQYIPRYAQPNSIIYALQDVTAPTREGTDIWPLVQANDPEALSELSRAIEATYNDRETDWAQRPYDEKVRGSQTFIIRTMEPEPRSVPFPETGLYERIIPPPGSANPATSGKLPSAGVFIRLDKNREGCRISRISIGIDGTFATKNTGDKNIEDREVRAMTTRAVNEFRDSFTDFLPVIDSDLASLAKLNPRSPVYAQPYDQIKEKLGALASALSQQTFESVLRPQDIDHDRVEGSKSTYAADSVYAKGCRGLPPIELNVVADYSRITGRESVDEAE
jgi:hypothetical protein